MALTVGSIVAYLRLNKMGYTTGLKTAQGEATTFSAATTKIFKTMAMAAVAAFAVITAVIIKTVSSASKFETQMANVSTMVTRNVQPTMDKFSKTILQMSKDFGEGTDTLSKGLYDILSAGIDTSQAIDVLEVSVRAARAGLTDTGVAADAITTILNAFSMEAEDAGHIADVLFQTVLRGKTTFDQLAPAIGQIATIAAQGGVTLEEMAASLAVMTRAGVQTDQAVTALKGVVLAFLKPSEEMAAMFGENALQAQGLGKIMSQLADLPADVLARLFPNVRGLLGAMTVAKEFTGEVEIFHQALQDGSPMLDAYEKQTQTFDFQWQRLLKTFEAVSIEMGQQLLPLMKKGVMDLITWIDKNKQAFIDFAKAIGNVVKIIIDAVKFLFDIREILIGVAIAAVAVPAVIGVITAALSAMGIAAGAALGPIGLLISGIVIIGGVIAVAARNMKEAEEEFKKFTKTAEDSYEKMRRAIDGTAESLDDYYDAQAAVTEKIEANNEAMMESYDWTQQQIDNHYAYIDSLEDKLAAINKNIEIEEARIEAEKRAEEERKRAEAEERKRAEEAKRRAQEKLDYEKINADRLMELKLTPLEKLAIKEKEEIERAKGLGADKTDIVEYYALKRNEIREKELQSARDQANEYVRLQEEAEKQRMDLIAFWVEKRIEQVTTEGRTVEDLIARELTFKQGALFEAYDTQKELIESQLERIEEGAEKEAELKKELLMLDLDYSRARGAIDFEYNQKLQEYRDNNLEAEEIMQQETADMYEYFSSEKARFEIEAARAAEKAWKDTYNGIMSIAQMTYSSLTSLVNQFHANYQSNLDAQMQSEIDAATTSIENEDDLQTKIDEIKKEYAEKEAKHKVAVFNWNKWANVAQIAMNTATAIIKALAELGPIAGPIMAGVVGAMGAAQTALVIAQEPPPIPKYQKGGLIEMQEGGLLAGSPGIDTNLIAASSGEYIINKEAASENLAFLEAINAGGSAAPAITIEPVPVVIVMNNREVGRGIIKFIEKESDRGGARINPRASRSRI